MGAGESTPSQEHEFTCGYRVISVHSGSPCAAAGLDVFFDFVVKANEVALDRESDAFMAIIKSSQDQQLRLTVYSVKTNSARDVTITPSDRWGGANKPPGTLGATIRFDQIQSPDEHAWHVLDIHPNSPASLAGLCAHTDYILSAVDLIFRDEGDLEYVLSRMLNKRVEFYVYSVASDSVREVSITPNPSWGGDGMLGCDIGRGILHRLPFEKGREQARVAQAEGAEGRGRPGAPAGLPTATPPAGSDGAAAAAGEGSQPAAPMIATAVASRVALDTVPPGTQTVVPVRGGAAAGAALTAVQKRAAAAVLGSFVADAATMGAHWIYDMAELQQRLGSHGATPEFHEPPACPYYDYSSGSLSPYGDEALVLLRCMSAGSDGRLDPALFADALFSWSKEYRDGGGFIDHATQGFQTRMLAGKTWPECGAEDKQANCLGKVAIVVARYAGTGDLVSKVTEAIRVHQDHDEAVNHGVAAALLLEQVVLGSSLRAALELSKASMDGSALAAVKAAEAASSRQSTADMLGELGHQLMPGEPKAALVGRSCGFPQALAGSLHAILGAQGDYVRGVRANLLAGGDNCCRASFVGAVLAALAAGSGEELADIVPPSWRQRARCTLEVEALATSLAACANGAVQVGS